jgi:hypothetical protein
MNNCNHRRYKKNFPFGKKSMPDMVCKDCGKIIKPKDLEKKENNGRKKRGI